MSIQFNFSEFSERENLVAQYVLLLSMKETDSDLFTQAQKGLGLNDGALTALDAQITQLETALNDAGGSSLSDLLAKATKSTCCS